MESLQSVNPLKFLVLCLLLVNFDTQICVIDPRAYSLDIADLWGNGEQEGPRRPKDSIAY